VILAAAGCAPSNLLASFRDDPVRTLHTTLLHEVEPGETLSHLALRYGVTVETIAQRNELEDPDRVGVGALLAIPLGGDS
jgi:hypothetical protein